MDRFTLMSVFVAVAEEEGFAAGARRLQISPPAATRAIAELEKRLKVKLLNRTTRYVRATEAGQRYLEDARRILEQVDAAETAATGINSIPQGPITVTAPVLFGRMFVIPGIVEYLKRYPGTEVSAQFLDRNVNLLEEGIDVGVRIGELPDSSMRALRVGSVRVVLCASPNYLERYGMPQQPDDLLEHSIISSSAGNNAVAWRFDSHSGARDHRIKPILNVNSNDSAIEAAVSGLGITRVLSYQAAPQLAAGKLQIVLSDHESAPRPIHVVHREGRYATSKVRAFIDLITERLRADGALN